MNAPASIEYFRKVGICLERSDRPGFRWVARPILKSNNRDYFHSLDQAWSFLATLAAEQFRDQQKVEIVFSNMDARPTEEVVEICRWASGAVSVCPDVFLRARNSIDQAFKMPKAWRQRLLALADSHGPITEPLYGDFLSEAMGAYAISLAKRLAKEKAHGQSKRRNPSLG